MSSCIEVYGVTLVQEGNQATNTHEMVHCTPYTVTFSEQTLKGLAVQLG